MAGEFSSNLSAGMAQSRGILKEHSNPVTAVLIVERLNLPALIVGLA
jgi:hypothetical protein